MAKRERTAAEVDAEIAEIIARRAAERTYEYDHNVSWKDCKHPGGCNVRCVYAAPGSDNDGEWMCCRTCGAMFCAEHRDHAVHGDGINPDSDAEPDDEEEEEEAGGE